MVYLSGCSCDLYIFSTFPTAGLATLLLPYHPHSFTAHKHLSEHISFFPLHALFFFMSLIIEEVQQLPKGHAFFIALTFYCIYLVYFTL